MSDLLLPADAEIELSQTLQRWREAGWLRRLDLAVVDFAKQHAELSPLVQLALVLLSHQAGRGHLCIDWAVCLVDPNRYLALPPDAAGEPLPTPAELLHGVDLAQLMAELKNCSAIAVVNSECDDTLLPWLLQETRLYQRRFFLQERLIAGWINTHTVDELAIAPEIIALLPTLFKAQDNCEIDWQQVACALALRQPFAVITGGPGTGKTTTVVKLLALLQLQALHTRGRGLKIALAAPTGKAAARLNESIQQQIANVLAALPASEHTATLAHLLGNEQVQTLHKLLGTVPNSRQFRHHAGQPLAVDMVVVDEASMIDSEMMAALIAALPEHARLVLLGDKDQLASVEAGAVLGQLCELAEQGNYQPATAAWLNTQLGVELPQAVLGDGRALDQTVAMLRKSWRFDDTAGIGQLARAVNQGDEATVLDLLQQASERRADPVLQWLQPEFDAQGQWDTLTQRWLLQQYQPYVEALNAFDAAQPDTMQKLLHALTEFQLLAALRRGRFGVVSINQRIEQLLHRGGELKVDGEWYHGRAVMVTANDYNLGLMNGDVGVCVATDNGLRVLFAGGEQPRLILASRLNQVETAFAMTVHKSQGSEFRHTALILPDQASPIVTRELFYTAITRAKKCFSLLASEPAVISVAVTKKVVRASGLAQALN